jgi:hypothetical protein
VPVAEQTAVAIRIGTSGWSYDHWAPELYAPGLPAGDRLARYAAAFATAELNSSFYRWPRPSAFSGWRRKLPDRFRLSVKAPRGLTHGRRLYAPEAWIQRAYQGFTELAGRAQSAGKLRADFVPEDLVILLMANAGVIAGTTGAAPGTWRRFAAYMTQAFSAASAETLPAPPPMCGSSRCARRAIR